MINTSGQGEKAVVPDEIDRWNWGAAFLNIFWGIGNKTYVAFLALVPVVNIFVIIALGLNGNKWAWKNKRWQSTEHFLSVQKKWNAAGFIVLAIYIFYFISGIYQLR